MTVRFSNNSKFNQMWRKNKYDLLGIVLRRYPKFILSTSASDLTEIPVFVFHNVTRDNFEPILMYLGANGYRTLNADELSARVMRGDPYDERKVVLSFDDGDKSLYSVAYPLLKKYNFTAVAFIVPGLIGDHDLGSHWVGSDNYLCTWSEIREMHKSGVIDFQAHSTLHNTIFISPQIIGYVTPNTNFAFLTGDIFPVFEDESTLIFAEDLPLGTPLYESGFRLAGQLKYIDSVSFRTSCVDYVSRNGGYDFFQHDGWKPRMDEYARSIFPDFECEARYELLEERDQAIRKDLRTTKRIIENKLEGKEVRHFCFPWFSGCPSAATISGEEGYLTTFWGGLVPKFAQSHPKPIAIPRLNPLYIWRLPGKGRKSLGEVLKRKHGSVIIQRMKKYELCK